jgi:integrase
MASIFKRNGKGNFVIQYTDHLGVRKEKASRTTDKRTAQALANKLESDAMLRREGIIDARVESFTKKAASPFQKHLDSFESKLKAEGRSEKHVEATVRCIDRVVAAKSLKTLGQLTQDTVMSYAESLRTSGRSPRTVHATLTALKALTKWLTLKGTFAADPLAGVKKPNPKSGRRRERRMLLPEEFSWLAHVTANEAKLHGMTGADRLLLYMVAIQTGLRANEIRGLKRGSMFLKGERPFLLAKAGTTKNGKPAHQYIKADLAAALLQYVESRPPEATIFPLPEKGMAAILRSDLAAARKAWLDQAKDDPTMLKKREESDFLLARNHSGEVLDFHALRHTCGAWAALGGAHPKAVQTLMRHSTITLTMDTYGHLFPGQDAETVHRLPDMTQRPADLQPTTRSEVRSLSQDMETKIGLDDDPSSLLGQMLGESAGYVR